jgi:hypothetical protein
MQTDARELGVPGSTDRDRVGNFETTPTWVIGISRKSKLTSPVPLAAMPHVA